MSFLRVYENGKPARTPNHLSWRKSGPKSRRAGVHHRPPRLHRPPADGLATPLCSAIWSCRSGGPSCRWRRGWDDSALRASPSGASSALPMTFRRAAGASVEPGWLRPHQWDYSALRASPSGPSSALPMTFRRAAGASVEPGWLRPHQWDYSALRASPFGPSSALPMTFRRAAGASVEPGWLRPHRPLRHPQKNPLTRAFLWVAERVGFEPTWSVKPPTDFESVPL